MKELFAPMLLALSMCAPQEAFAQELPPVPEPYTSVERNFVRCNTESQLINEFVNINAPVAEGCVMQRAPVIVNLTPVRWVYIENDNGSYHYLIGTAIPAEFPTADVQWVVMSGIKVEEDEAV